MTNEQFREKIDILKSDLSLVIDETVEEIIESEEINLDNYDNNFILPKIFFQALEGDLTCLPEKQK